MNNAQSALTVAAILPVYNEQEQVQACLDSLASQTRAYDEIIVIDDGSSDDTVQTVLSYAAAHSLTCLRVISHDENKGVAAAMNTGLAAAKSDLVHFVAADDSYHAALVNCLAGHMDIQVNAAFACADVEFTGLIERAHRRLPFGTKARVFSADDAQHRLPRVNFLFFTGAALIRRSILKKTGVFEQKAAWNCDWLMLFKLALTYGFVYEPQPLMRITMRAASYSGSRTTQMQQDVNTYLIQDIGNTCSRQVRAAFRRNALLPEFRPSFLMPILRDNSTRWYVSALLCWRLLAYPLAAKASRLVGDETRQKLRKLAGM